MMRTTRSHLIRFGILALMATACSPEPEGIGAADEAATTVKLDFFHKPFPEIPLPNDVATRYDVTSPTKRRINASMIAPTGFEVRIRELLDSLDGWGLFQPISIPFTGPLDIGSIVAGHRDDNYDPNNDVIYLINIDEDSSSFGKLYHLDVGNGNYPVVVERRDKYWPHDPSGDSLSLGFNELDEDLNQNGVLDLGEDINGNGALDPGEDVDGDGQLDPPEDIDADGILDTPNYLPPELRPPNAADPLERTNLAGRADALMSFYERSTNTLIVRPLIPLDERTTYAVVVTKRIKDASGNSVGSPYPFINHNSQTAALEPLPKVLPPGLSMADVAFAFTFTTQTVQSDWIAVRDGLYGHGVQKHIGEEFPAEVAELLPLRDQAAFPSMKRPHLAYGENWRAVLESPDLPVGDDNMRAILVEASGYIDYIVVGKFRSAQLFDRYDENNQWIGLNDQSWPTDLSTIRAKARSEDVYFSLAVPRKEISVRGQGKPAPVMLMAHGYGSSRFEGQLFSGFVVKHGLAAMMIDAPSHAIGIPQAMKPLVSGLLGGVGLSALGEAAFKGRAFDQDNDGELDIAVDFLTSYLFHTRDMLRQTAFDYMQLIRILRSFDGTRRWNFDTNGDGELDLAGDFDGDGQVDIGGVGEINMFGGSLGGMTTAITGALETELTAVSPVAGGAGFSDMGPRSLHGGIPEGFILRGMGPLYVGTAQANESTLIETIVPDLNDTGTFSIATTDANLIQPWDTVVVHNLANGKLGCAYVNPEGNFRVSVESDLGDSTRLYFYKGPQLLASEDCELRDTASEPYLEIDRFSERVVFQGKEHEAESELVALAEGLGLRRSHPDLRRFSGLGQLILDRTDPGAFARHLLKEPLTYPGTGKSTGAHALVMTFNGDMDVPTAAGVSYGRAIGLIDYLNIDPRYGKPVNQVLLDTHTAEGVHLFKRYTDPSGNGVHIDLENFSQGTDIWGADIPRLDPPLHIGINDTDRWGGRSAALFPYNVPEGSHVPPNPGDLTQKARDDCEAACDPPGTCGCDILKTFDPAFFLFNLLGRYIVSGGNDLRPDLCLSHNDCADFAAAPPARDIDTLP